MQFSVVNAIEVLERTPQAIFHLVDNLSAEWTNNNEGGDTWSVYDVVGHLIHGDQTDWITRAELILSNQADKRFVPFDRFAQFENSKGKSLTDLLKQFEEIRTRNIEKLRALNISDIDLQETGVHPVFGEVTLAQLLSTWVVHDLDHISQISRVMAKQYLNEVGPWIEYLKVLRS